MEEPVSKRKKTRRKILCDEDLNQMDRRSLKTTSFISCESKKKISKKNKDTNKKSISNNEFEEFINKDYSSNEGRKRNGTPRNTQIMFVVNFESENITPDRRSVKVNTRSELSSSDFAITPTVSEEISDDVFSDSFKLSDTLECGSIKRENTFELQNTTFDVSKLPHIDDDTKTESKSHHPFKRSKSLDQEKSYSVKKSVSFMVNNKFFGDDVSFVEKSTRNLSQPTRKSVRISECNNYSKNYPKSTHVKKLSSLSLKTSELNTSDEINNKSAIYESNDSRHSEKSKLTINDKSNNKINNESFETNSDNSLGNKVTKRKTWNKSLGVSFFDCSGLLVNISPPIDLSPDSSSNPFKTNKSVQSEVITSTAAKVKKNNNKSKIGVKKIPNFALIHQRALNKIENLTEMTERKALRAQRLLSGRKPGLDLDSKPSSSTKSPKCKLLLSFTPNKRKSIDKLNKSATINVQQFLPSSSKKGVLTKKKVNKEIRSNIPLIIKKPVEKKKILSKKPEDTKKVLPKVYSKGEKQSKQDQVKAVATKSKPERNLLEARKKLTQHVRTNRRFELLMQMRNKK